MDYTSARKSTVKRDPGNIKAHLKARQISKCNVSVIPSPMDEDPVYLLLLNEIEQINLGRQRGARR